MNCRILRGALRPFLVMALLLAAILMFWGNKEQTLEQKFEQHVADELRSRYPDISVMSVEASSETGGVVSFAFEDGRNCEDAAWEKSQGSYAIIGMKFFRVGSWDGTLCLYKPFSKDVGELGKKIVYSDEADHFIVLKARLFVANRGVSEGDTVARTSLYACEGINMSDLTCLNPWPRPANSLILDIWGTSDDGWCLWETYTGYNSKGTSRVNARLALPGCTESFPERFSVNATSTLTKERDMAEEGNYKTWGDQIEVEWLRTE